MMHEIYIITSYNVGEKKRKTKKMGGFCMNQAKLVIYDQYFRVRDDAFSFRFYASAEMYLIALTTDAPTILHIHYEWVVRKCKIYLVKWFRSYEI